MSNYDDTNHFNRRSNSERNDGGERTPLLAGIPSFASDDSHVQIHPPSSNDTFQFNFRRMLKFAGPGLLISIAYLDPGNIESDLQSGTALQYKLLWVLLWATILGLLTQRLVARLGVVSGKPLAELCYRLYPRTPRLLLWIMMEIAIIGSDIQEVIGTAIAFSLISNKAIPIWGGVLLTLVDTFTFLMLENYGLRKLEAFFGFLIAVMAITFGYEYVKAAPDQAAVAEGIVIPWCSKCDPTEAVLQAVGVVGACIMPHNLYLHSSLVKSRKIDRNSSGAIKEANLYYLIETAFALFVSFFINLFVVGVFAHGLYGKTYHDVHVMCLARNDTEGTHVFPDTNDIIEPNIYLGGIYLGCQYGAAAMYIWAIGIFAAGQSSTMTGTYSGQIVMEGFLNLKWKKWQRVLVTRSTAILPTLFLALYKGITDLTELNDLMNALMTIMLPFAIIPALTMTNSPVIMGDFRNGRFSRIIMGTLSASIIVVNYGFIIYQGSQMIPLSSWYVWLIVGFVLCLYTVFVGYLVWFQLVVEGCLPQNAAITAKLQALSVVLMPRNDDNEYSDT